MDIRLGEAEYRLMEILWKNQSMRARELAAAAKEEEGWEKNTTYTMIHRLIEKGAIRRGDPDFVCTPLIHKNGVRRQEMRALLDRVFDGSAGLFFQTFIREQNLTKEELEEIQRIIDEKK